MITIYAWLAKILFKTTPVTLAAGAWYAIDAGFPGVTAAVRYAGALFGGATVVAFGLGFAVLFAMRAREARERERRLTPPTPLPVPHVEDERVEEPAEVTS